MNSDKKIEILKEIYFNPASGYQSEKKLFEKVRKKGIKLKEVKSFLKSLEVNQIFKEPKKTSQYRPIFCVTDNCYQADITFLNKMKRGNNNYNSILNMINITSRYVYAVPLKSKSQIEITEAFKNIFEKMKKDKRSIDILTTDNGSEFLNSKLKKLLETKRIKHLTNDPGDHHKMGMIERFHRTLRTMIKKYLQQNNTTRWVDKLDDFIYNYNNSYHNSLKMKPSEVGKEDKKRINKKAIEKTTKINEKEDIEIGDNVRKLLKKKVFGKDELTYSKGVYKVVDRNNNTYKLKNSSGTILQKNFKFNELQKINIDNLIKISEGDEISKEKEHQSINRRLRKEGLGMVDDNNQIILNKRLKPKNRERIIKIPDKIRKRDKIKKDVLGKNKEGILIKTRRHRLKDA